MAGTSTTTAVVRPARPQTRWSDPAECTLEDLLGACFYGVGAVYRREVFEAVGGFREDIYAEDYLFWLLAWPMASGTGTSICRCRCTGAARRRSPRMRSSCARPTCV